MIGAAGSGFRLPVPARLAAKMGDYVGRQVVLGIRPEHLHLAAAAASGDFCAIEARVNVIEPLGNDMDVYVRTAARRSGGAGGSAGGLEPGMALTLYADLRRAHFSSLVRPG